MAPFLAGLEEAHLVRTPAFDELDNAADFVVARSEILVLDGDGGVGKTVLTDDFATRQAVPVSIIELPPRQTSREMVRWMHQAVCSETDSDELSERDIQDALLRMLTEPRIVIVRNAHRLSVEASGQLEWLHSHRATSFSLVIEGGMGTVNAIEREALLRGRVASTIRVLPLQGQELLRTLQAMHTLFLGADTDLLTEIDTRVCHGIIRNWARILQSALHLQQRAVANGKAAPVLDRAFAKVVLAELPSLMTRKRS
ncbi:MAG: hypothetical protein RL487_821 [Actinomycetota bacterium]|jgi:DNA transposition AAA+ family ATPase